MLQSFFIQLPVLLQALVLFGFAVVALFTVLSGIAKAFGWKRATALCASLAIDVGKGVAVLQGHLPINKPEGPLQ